MGKVVNLRRAVKARARAERAARGAANAARHGRSAAERAEDDRASDAARRRLDGHRRDEGPDGP